MIYKSYLIEQNLSTIKTNINLFYGENFGLKNEFKEKLRTHYTKAQKFNINQEEIIKNEDLVYNEIFNLSLFDNEKIIFINQANDKILEFIKKIESKLENQKIFIFADLLDKKSRLRSHFEKSKNTGAIACYEDNSLTLKKIILEKLKDFKGLSSENINLILDNVYSDRVKLNNELKKIITYFNDKILDKEKLEALLNLKINENFNELKDEALKGNKNNVNKLLNDTVIEDEKSAYYISIINQRLMRIAEVNNLLKSSSLENAINSLKPPIFWKDKPAFTLQVQKWTSNKIRKILNSTYDLEINIKSNSLINNKILIKKLILDICILANA